MQAGFPISQRPRAAKFDRQFRLPRQHRRTCLPPLPREALRDCPSRDGPAVSIRPAMNEKNSTKSPERRPQQAPRRKAPSAPRSQPSGSRARSRAGRNNLAVRVPRQDGAIQRARRPRAALRSAHACGMRCANPARRNAQALRHQERPRPARMRTGLAGKADRGGHRAAPAGQDGRLRTRCTRARCWKPTLPALRRPEGALHKARWCWCSTR